MIALSNAMAESFFATLECELLQRRSFQNQAQARMAIFAFVESFYNTRRLHSALGYLSPNEFERRAPPRRRARWAPRGIANKALSGPCGSSSRGSTTTL